MLNCSSIRQDYNFDSKPAAAPLDVQQHGSKVAGAVFAPQHIPCSMNFPDIDITQGSDGRCTERIYHTKHIHTALGPGTLTSEVDISIGAAVLPIDSLDPPCMSIVLQTAW